MRRFYILAATSLLIAVAGSSNADIAGETLAKRVFERPSNEGRTGEMNFSLQAKSGRSRERVAIFVQSDADDISKIAIHFTAPSAIQDTAFLSHDREGSNDESWLFLPATDRVRRLPSSDRGDYFMGTDMTYGDIRDNFRFQLEDWEFTEGSPTTNKGEARLKLSGLATAQARKELGYASFTATIDPETLCPVNVTYTDRDGAPLKRVVVTDQERVSGVWAARAFTIENLQTGHSTKIDIQNMRAKTDLDPHILEADSLEYGAPDV